MVCTTCGREIPDERMYCEACGTERQMVPEYDAALENEIDATLFNMAKEIRSDSEGKKETVGVRLYIPKRMLTIASVIVLLILTVVIVAVVAMRSPKDHVADARQMKDAGNTTEAISILKKAIQDEPSNSEAILLLSQYYQEEGMDDEALDTLDAIVNSVLFPDEETARAYRDTADIYLRGKDFGALYKLMQKCPFEDIKDTYLKAMPDGPAITPEGGTFTEETSVTMTAASGSRIYYSFGESGDTVDENSIPYTEPVVLDEDGTYLIRAVAYDGDNVPTLISEAEFVIELPNVMPPQILEDSGVYTQDTKIVAFAEPGCDIYYTTDGSDPDTTSRKYSTPITMPHGSSHFRFIAVNADGELSEITEREYELSLPRYVTREQAVASVIDALVAERVLLDGSGKTMGQEGYNSYAVAGVINIGESGEFYEIHEHHVNDDGSSEPTGLLYAVNTNTGGTYRLGYDSAGRYLLIQLR